MDDLRRKIFDVAWGEYARQSGEFANFLDTLYQEELVTTPEYTELRQKNGKELLKLINAILVGSKNGYNIFLKELKDNFGWIHKRMKEMEADEELKRSVHTTALITGGVPRPPQFYIERTQLLNELKDKLRALQPKYSNKIVLYGMNGVGKSCLASAALRDVDLLLDGFNNKVFWINVGKVDEDQIFEIMFRLYRKIMMLYKKNVGDHLPQEKPSNIAEMSDNLLILFQSDYFKNTLVVLNNVFCKNVIKYFDVGCNLLIIAQERISINKENVHFMSVQDGFSEEESLMVFANCMDVSFERIKRIPEASLIHHWCKGDPNLISLYATKIQERKSKLLRNEKEWKYLCDALSKKKISMTEKRFKTISLCLESLEPELRLKYEDFAVFVYDINIKPEVLMVLWGMEKEDVEEVMEKFLKKCLVVSNYNDDQNSDVYGIHHIFLDYLKENAGSLVDLHKKLLARYRDVCQNDYAQLPNDNYIYQYIGYHLSEAKQYKDFSIYFDLNFIGAKIRATGIADLLRDYTTYKDLITDQKENLEEKLLQYKNFVEMYGQNLHTYTHTDIIQSALQLPKDNVVYRTALNIANDRRVENLYFTMHAPHESNYYTHTLIVNDKFKAACFTEETKEILIGTESGTIEMWEPKYAHKIQTFEKHNDAIVFLRLNECRDKFISISKDGIMKLWDLAVVKEHKRRSHGTIFNENGFSQHIPSPQIKQENHQMFFGSDTKIDRSETFKLDDDKIISAAFCLDYKADQLLVTGTEKGKIAVWKDCVVKHLINLKLGPINCVGFSNDDTVFIATCKSDIFLYDTNSGEFLLKLRNSVKSTIEAMHVIPYDDDINGMITVQDVTVIKWTWEQSHNVNNQIELRNHSSVVLITEKDENTTFVCSTITQKFLVVGSSDNRIRMWDLEKKAVVEDFCDQSGLVICLDACVNSTDNSIQILLTGFEDQTVKTWHVRPNQTAGKTVKRLPMFSSYWRDESLTRTARSPLLALLNTANKIQILKGHKLVVETDPITNTVTSITFDLYGNNVFYGTDKGDVFLYSIKNKANKKVMKLDGSVAYLEAINVGGGNYLDEPLLVASSELGVLSIYHKNQCRMLIGLCDNTKIPLVPILKCYYVKQSRNQLLTIGKNRMMMKCWDIETSSNAVVLYSDNNFNVHHTMTCISNDHSLICITTNKNLQVFRVDADENNLATVRIQGRDLDDCICSCCFSNNNQYLALGCDNGNVVIWDVDKKRVYTNLSLHKSCVRNVYFSPSEQILVTVGEQISWWNIKLIPDSFRRSFRSRSNSTKLPIKPMTIDLMNNFSSLNIDENWSRKRGPESLPHLLATIKLHGLYAEHLSYSHEFDSFLTVDNHGEIYIMDVL